MTTLSGRWHTERLRGPRRPRPSVAWIATHDLEHAWRMSGEWAIREEMERRVAAWLAHKLRRTS